MSSLIQTPLPVPSHPDVPPPHELSEKEQAECDRVLAHFTDSGYELPGVENGVLMEEECMWLVRRLPSFFARPISPSPVIRVHPALHTRHETRRV